MLPPESTDPPKPLDYRGPIAPASHSLGRRAAAMACLGVALVLGGYTVLIFLVLVGLSRLSLGTAAVIAGSGTASAALFVVAWRLDRPPTR